MRDQTRKRKTLQGGYPQSVVKMYMDVRRIYIVLRWLYIDLRRFYNDFRRIALIYIGII